MSNRRTRSTTVKRMAVFLLCIIVASLTGPVVAAKSATIDFNLPVGHAMTQDELDNVKGKGFGAALYGAVLGASTSYVGYTFDYAWDRYVERKTRRWNWREAGRLTVKGAVLGGMAGLAAPLP